MTGKGVFGVIVGFPEPSGTGAIISSRQAPEAPPPYPEAWGRTPPLPCPIEMSEAVHAEGGSFAAKLDALSCDPRDDGANALARLFRLLDAKKC